MENNFRATKEKRALTYLYINKPILNLSMNKSKDNIEGQNDSINGTIISNSNDVKKKSLAQIINEKSFQLVNQLSNKSKNRLNIKRNSLFSQSPIQSSKQSPLKTSYNDRFNTKRNSVIYQNPIKNPFQSKIILLNQDFNSKNSSLIESPKSKNQFKNQFSNYLEELSIPSISKMNKKQKSKRSNEALETVIANNDSNFKIGAFDDSNCILLNQKEESNKTLNQCYPAINIIFNSSNDILKESNSNIVNTLICNKNDSLQHVNNKSSLKATQTKTSDTLITKKINFGIQDKILTLSDDKDKNMKIQSNIITNNLKSRKHLDEIILPRITDFKRDQVKLKRKSNIIESDSDVSTENDESQYTKWKVKYDNDGYLLKKDILNKNKSLIKKVSFYVFMKCKYLLLMLRLYLLNYFSYMYLGIFIFTNFYQLGKQQIKQ